MLQADITMQGTHDLRLVALSIVTAVFSSYTALDLAERVRTSKGKVRLAWLIGGAIVMGAGIWSMHFVAMLAFMLPIPMVYNVFTVCLSILPAIIASGGALILTRRQTLSQSQLLIGGVLMGIGIASMHYIGMAAMEIDAKIRYNPFLLVLSIAIAIAASIAALWITMQLRTQSHQAARSYKILSAIIMGIAIAGMHYTGMAAASFQRTNSVAVAKDAMQASLSWLGVGIGIGTIIILASTLLASFVDRQMLAQQMMLFKQQEIATLRSQVFSDIAFRIRQSLNLEDVLSTAVHEIRQAMKFDRAIVYYFNTDWTGTIIAESVAEGWIKTLGQTVNNPFRSDDIEMYKNGRVRATDNIYEAEVTKNHREILENFQIKSSLIAPIILDNKLTGLLCGHQCSDFRNWEVSEIDLFQQIGIQVSIAIEQANLLQELKQAQEVLRLRDRAIAAANNAIVITDSRQPDHPIIFCNPAFETITGYSLQEVLGRNCRFLQGKDTDPNTIKQIRNLIKEGHECQVVIQNYRKDGTSFWNQLTISPVKDVSGKITHFVGIQTDITERKRVEEQLRKSQEVLQQQLIELIDEVNEVANGDLTIRAKIPTGQIGIVADFFNTIIASLRQIVFQVKQAAQQVNNSIGENSDSIRQLANEAFKQAEEITRTLEEVDQMNLSIQAVADSANQAAKVAARASNTAIVAGEAMERTVTSILNLKKTVADTAEKIRQFDESSQEISRVVTLIDQIALQTNLLSINASIEASHAGEESQGFVVVAQEVGRLAAQSIQATREIEHIVQTIRIESNEIVRAIEAGTTQVVEGAQLVKDTKHSLEQILDESHQIDELIQSISQATVSQAQTSQNVTLLMKEIAKASEVKANASQAVSESLQQTVEVAQQLQASVSVFKTDG
jgi:methyl-accepting chemotaxis protein PixJ